MGMSAFLAPRRQLVVRCAFNLPFLGQSGEDAGNRQGEAPPQAKQTSTEDRHPVGV
jgi:hypothetical protein